jgi:TolB protein
VRGSRSVTSLGLCALVLLLSAGPAGAAATRADNQQAPLNNLVLQDLGKKTAAISSLAWSGTGFAVTEVWRSEAGAFDATGALFAVADFTGDGLPDALTLRPLGKSGARIDLFASNGAALTPTVAWRSAKAGFKAASAKAAAGDVNGDGRAELLVLAPSGARAQVLCFAVRAKSATKTSMWTGTTGAAAAASQIACADLDGDGRTDAVVLGVAGARSFLQGLCSNGKRLAARYAWRGALPAGSQLAAGTTRGTSDAEAIVLTRKSASSAAFYRFAPKGKGFAKSRVWSGPLATAGTRVACTDVNADGKSDLLTLAPKGGKAAQARAFLSHGARLTGGATWDAGAAAPSLRLAAAPSLPAILSARTEVLSDSEGAKLVSVSADQTVLTFSGPAPKGLKVGDVLTIGSCAAAPDGLIRKVTAIQTQGATTVVTTADAALQDAAQSLDVSYGAPVAADDLGQATYLRKGVRLVRPPLGARGERALELKWELNDVDIAGLTANGEVVLRQDFDFRVKVSWFKLKLVRFTTTTTQSSSLTLSKIGEWQFLDKRVTIASYHFKKPIVIWIGPFPVTLHPSLEIYIGADGKVQAGITTGVGEEMKLTLGADYVPGRKGPDFQAIENHSLTGYYDPPSIVANASLEGYAGASFATLIYGLAGPELFLEGYGNLTLDIAAAHWWSIVAGLRAGVGFTFPALDLEWRWSPGPIYEWELAHSSDPPPAQHASLGLTAGCAEKDYGGTGDVLHYTATATNSGNQALTGVTPTAVPALENVVYRLGAAGKVVTPPVSLLPGQSLVATGTHTVTMADVTGGSFGVTFTADSAQTTPVTAPITVPHRAKTPICTNAALQESPAISGNTVVWTDSRNGNKDIYGYDLASKSEFAVCTAAGNQYEPAISGNYVVWTDERNDTKDIYGVDLSSPGRVPFAIRIGAGDQYEPAVSGTRVVWTDASAAYGKIYFYNLATPATPPTAVVDDGVNADQPAISGTLVAWCWAASYVYCQEIPSGSKTLLSETDASSSPAVSATRVVWQEVDAGVGSIYGSEPGNDRVVICADGKYSTQPAISGIIVVWRKAASAAGQGDIYGYNRTSQTSFAVCTDAGEQSQPAIDAGNVVWADAGDIYSTQVGP